MTREKIERMRSKKSLEQAREKLLNNIYGSWIEWVGYDRKAHVEEMKELVKLINSKLETLS